MEQRLRSVDLVQLRRVADRLFDLLESHYGSEYPLDRDFFWAVESTQLYDPYNEPTFAGLGSLYDILDRIERLDREPSSAVGLDIEALGVLLMALVDRSKIGW